jgi:hypothetical protein
LNKIVLFIILIFISGNLKAQSNLQQIAFGAGAGAATAYTGTQLQKTMFAWFVDAGYCPVPFLNINIEGQAGALAGASLNAKNIKSFNNNYRAAILNAELKPGMFFDYGQSDFLSAVKNIYIGAGFGLLNNNIVNVKISDPQITDHIKNTIYIIPFKLGYEFILLKRYNEPKLKADLSYSFNYTIERGLDGYTDSNSKAFYFYNYYAIGLKYAINIFDRSGKRHYKLQ